MPVAMKELFQTVDSMDAQGFSRHFTEGARFRFGNAPTLSGREAIAASIEEFFSGLTGLRHKILDTWELDDIVVAEVEVVYTRKDGEEGSPARRNDRPVRRRSDARLPHLHGHQSVIRIAPPASPSRYSQGPAPDPGVSRNDRYRYRLGVDLHGSLNRPHVEPARPRRRRSHGRGPGAVRG